MPENSFDSENPMFRKGVRKRVSLYGIAVSTLVLIMIFVLLLKGPTTRLEKESAVVVGLLFTFILSYFISTIIPKGK